MLLPAVNLLSSVITQVPLYRGDRAAVYFGPQNVCISGNASEEPRGIFWLTAQNRTFAQKKFLQIGAAPYAKQGALPLACLADPSVQSQVSSGFMTLGSRGYSWPIWTLCNNMYNERCAYIPDSLRIAATRLRLSSHRLRLETGRWSRLPRAERVCRCAADALQDEHHVVFHCPLSLSIRSELPPTYRVLTISFLMDATIVTKICHKVLQLYE